MAVLHKGDKGEAAIAANKMLMGHNVFQHQTLLHVQHSEFTDKSAQAAKDMKWWLGYRLEDCVPTFGPQIKAYLLGHKKLSVTMHLRRRRRKYEKQKFICPVDGSYKLIGWPGLGTHSWYWPPNNWESDNANDAGCHMGTPVVAVADGVIGPSFGPLENADPRFHGIRLHLETADNEVYYAHLMNTGPGIKPGAHIPQGRLLGHSGKANGVEHLHVAVHYGNPTQLLFS